jgi:protein SPA2
MAAKNADLVVIRDLDGQLKEYKYKYEQSRAELRIMKGNVLAS